MHRQNMQRGPGCLELGPCIRPVEVGVAWSGQSHQVGGLLDTIAQHHF